MTKQSNIKSIRLSEVIRNGIKESILDKWRENNPEPDKIKAADALANNIWNRVHGKHAEVLKAVPKEYLKTNKSIAFTYKGDVESVESILPLPTKHGNYCYNPIIVLKDNDKPYAKYLAVKEAHAEWVKEREELDTEAKVILDSVNTTGQLLEVWPMVEPFLPAHIASPNKGVNLPAIQVSRLNEKIGIK